MLLVLFVTICIAALDSWSALPHQNGSHISKLNCKSGSTKQIICVLQVLAGRVSIQQTLKPRLDSI